MKFPTFRKSAAEWFEPLRLEDVCELIIPGLNVPLIVVEPTEEEMSRRNIPRPVILTRTMNPARNRGPLETQREKRRKITHDSATPSSSLPPHPKEFRALTLREKENVIEPQVDTSEPPVEVDIRRVLSPSYTSPNGWDVLLTDSVKAEPSLVVTLLRGLALPRGRPSSDGFTSGAR